MSIFGLTAWKNISFSLLPVILKLDQIEVVSIVKKVACICTISLKLYLTAKLTDSDIENKAWIGLKCFKAILNNLNLD